MLCFYLKENVFSPEKVKFPEMYVINIAMKYAHILFNIYILLFAYIALMSEYAVLNMAFYHLNLNLNTWRLPTLARFNSVFEFLVATDVFINVVINLHGYIKIIY